MESNQILLLTKIRKGFDCLERVQSYGQVNVLRKLNYLQHDVSASTFSKILNEENEKPPRVDTLRPYELGIEEILKSELNMSFNEKQKTYFQSPAFNWEATIIPELSEEETKGPGDLIYNEAGRLLIKEKVAFMKEAKKEIIEFGLRLKSFSEYFTNRREQEFKQHIDELLQQGVHIKVYLLDPTSNEASIYFQDRALSLPKENKSIATIQESIVRLKELVDEYDTTDYDGKFEVFLYKHVPYNHFLIIDGATLRDGAMIVSHYIYGVRRAECPTIQFSKTKNTGLYKRYWQSFQALSKDALSLAEWLKKYKHSDSF